MLDNKFLHHAVTISDILVNRQTHVDRCHFNNLYDYINRDVVNWHIQIFTAQSYIEKKGNLVR